jgi:hypothetical protein
MKYSEKLRDPRWQRKRLEIMQRDDFTCLACGDKNTTLNVHHLQYAGNPWDAKDESLETLCEPCHDKRSKLNKQFLDIPTKEALKIELNASCEYNDDGFYNEKLMCNIIKYYNNNYHIYLFLPESDSPDMTGCISFCKDISPLVTHILIFNKDRRSGGYTLKNGQWSSYDNLGTI